MQKLVILVLVCLAVAAFVEGSPSQRPNRGGRRGSRRPKFEVVKLDEECTPEKARQDGCQCTPRPGNWACDECNKCICTGGVWGCHLMLCIPPPANKCYKPVKFYNQRLGRTRTMCGQVDC